MSTLETQYKNYIDRYGYVSYEQWQKLFNKKFQNMNIIQQINKFKETNKKGILIEVGAGMPVYNLLCQYPNTASKIVYYAESPNNWEYSQKKYSHSTRAISPDVCENIIIHHKSNNKNIDYVLVNTIQIANTPDTETHGWFGLCMDNIYRYFHFYIESGKTRKEQIEIIGEIGIQLLNNQLHNCIDIVLDQDFNDDLEYLLNGKLNSISNNQNTITVINKHGKLTRLTEFLRHDFKDLCILKGSFNPVHDHHINLLEKTKQISNNSYGVFCISINHRHKGALDVQNLIKRIKLINHIGYSVLIDTNGLFYDCYSSITKNVSFICTNKYLRFVLGTDVLVRLIEDIDLGSTIENGKLKPVEVYDIDKCSFSYLKRNIDDNVTIPDYFVMSIQELEMESSIVSSTQIREYIENNEIDKLKGLISDNLFESYKNIFIND